MISLERRRVSRFIKLRMAKGIDINYIALPGLIEKYVFQKSKIYTPTVIEKIVCDYYGVSFKSLLTKDRRGGVVACRQVIMFLMRRYTNVTLKGIGEKFNRDHTTVIYAIERVLDLLETDEQFKKEMNHLESKIR